MNYASLQDYWPPECKEIYSVPLEELSLFKKTGCLYVYGEIQEAGIVTMMNHIPIRSGKFVDLGSGRGAVAAFTCVNYGYGKCVGVELSETRHNEARRLVKGASKSWDFSKLQLVCDDFFNYDLSDADVVYSANCGFGSLGINKVFVKACQEMKPGSFFLSMRSAGSVYKRLHLVSHFEVPTSWTMNMSMYLYRLGGWTH